MRVVRAKSSGGVPAIIVRGREEALGGDGIDVLNGRVEAKVGGHGKLPGTKCGFLQ